MKKVLVTGATSGIGRQLALDYAQQGVGVIACGRSEEKLAGLAAQCDGIETRCFDITDAQACVQALASLPEDIDGWIFNAGDCLYLEDGVIELETVKRVMDCNFYGLVHCLNACQHHFQAGHHVVVVGSIASHIPLPRAEVYGASKAAVDYFANTLAIAYRQRGIHCSLVYPGFVDTPLTQKNTFSMPGVISGQRAAQIIIKQLKRKKTHIYFPKRLTWVIRLLAILPHGVAHWLGRQMIKK